MPPAKQIDFNNAVRKLVKTQFHNIELQGDGIVRLCQMLNFINATLLKEFEDNYAKANKLNPDSFLLFAKRAIEKVFGSDLKKYAIVEAQKQLMLAESGCLKYLDASVNKTPAVKRKKEDCQKMSFKSGVSKLHKTFDTGLILEKETIDNIGSNLLSCIKMVTAKVCSTCKKDELQPIDFKNALPEYLGEDVLKHAFSEGNKSLALYSNKLLTFQPQIPFFEFDGPSETDSHSPTYGSSSQETFSREIFKSHIKKYLSRLKTDIDPNGLKFLSYILMAIGDYLSLKTAEMCERNEVTDMTDSHLNRVVTDTFSGQLKQHALIQGSLDVDNYHKGYLKYNKPPEKRIMEKKIIPKRAVKRKAEKGPEPAKKKRVKSGLPKAKKSATRSRKVQKK